MPEPLYERLRALDNNLQVRSGLVAALKPNPSDNPRGYLAHLKIGMQPWGKLIEHAADYLVERVQHEEDFRMAAINGLSPNRFGKRMSHIPGFREEFYLRILDGRIRTDRVSPEVLSRLYEEEGLYFLAGNGASVSPEAWYDIKMTDIRLNAWPVSQIIGWTIGSGVISLDRSTVYQVGFEEMLGKALPKKEEIREAASFARHREIATESLEFRF